MKKEVTIDLPEKVKILGISGSGRKMISYEMVKFTLKAAESVGYVDTEFLSLADYHFTPCNDCKRCAGVNKPADDPPMCYEDPADQCPIVKDKMSEADAVLIGFPVYTNHVNGLTVIAMEKPIGGGGGAGGPRLSTAQMGQDWWGHGYKPHAVISQGGQNLAGEEICYWYWARRGFISGAWPTVEDPEPQAAFEGGILSCNDGISVYARNAWMADTQRVNPPLMGIANERTLRNLGRWLAVSTMMFKIARLACQNAEIKAPESQYFVRYSQKAKPGSIVVRLMTEGKITYVSPEEMESRKKIKA
ncbi:MAG: flavodoxin family protein [Chloroflexi bacterium]|nr:flavodoxin family protein [Chloroflexota bacterium]